MMKYEEEENKNKSKELSKDAFSMPDSPTGMKVIIFVRFIFEFFIVDHWICVDFCIL